MEHSKPVTAIISFQLLPDSHQEWLQAWEGMRAAALAQPACRQFRLLCDRNDDAHCAVLTEWDRGSDFDAFMREAGVIWFERCLDGTCQPPAHSIFEAIPLDTRLATQERSGKLVAVG